MVEKKITGARLFDAIVILKINIPGVIQKQILSF